jgi:hypothetical protein
MEVSKATSVTRLCIGDMRIMRLLRRLPAAIAALSVAALLACNRAATSRESTPSVGPGFPDSVTANRGLPPRAVDSMAVLLGDTILQTSVITSPVTPTHPMHPMQLGLRIFVHDTSVSVRRGGPNLRLTACPFSLRLYRNGDRSTVPAWRSDKAGPSIRCPVLERFDTSRTDVTATWDVSHLLGDSLPAGRYAFGYAVRTADGRVFDFAAGPRYLTTDRTLPTSDLSGVQFAASSEIVGNGPRMLKTVATLRNATRRAVLVRFGACNVNLRLYRNAERTGLPVWRSEYRKAPGDRYGYACPLVLNTPTVLAGDSLTFGIAVPIYEVTADSLAAGRYYVSAELSLINEARRPEAPRILDAGSIDITRAPDPLPSSREIDGLTYTATTRLIRGAGGADTVRTLVLVTNSTNARRTALASRDCQVVAYPFRSAALRDSVPIQPPLSYSNASCSDYPYPFALDPRQSWVFARDVPVSVARQTLGSRHFWFTAWLLGTPSPLLAAGDIELPKP